LENSGRTRKAILRIKAPERIRHHHDVFQQAGLVIAP
jgi:hypothetical protein